MGFSFLLLLVIFIILIVSIVQFGRLRDRITNLEWQFFNLNKLADQVKNLEDRIASLKIPEGSAKKKEEPVPAAAVETQKSALIQSDQTIKSVVQKTEQPVYLSEPPKSRTREEWESFIGGKLLNRIGALALIMGLGFFLKYAFDNDWISETTRVLIGAVAGLTCIGLAYRTNKKGFQIFAQGLVGAGIAILYLSVYASFNFYSLVPQWTAFILMSLVTCISLTIGLYYNSLAVSLLGWAGGFLTPIMLSTGTVNEIGLFTYISLLDVGLLAIVLAKKEWNIIEPLTLAGTWILYFAWYFQYYKESDLIVTTFFISVFWILFFILDGSRLRFTGAADNAVQHIIAASNLILFYSMLYTLVNEDHHSWMGGVTLFLACIYVGTFLWLQRSGIGAKTIIVRYTISAIALAVIATSIQFEDFTTILLWSIEAALLIWCGTYWKQKFTYLTAEIIFAIAALKYLYTDGAFEYVPIDQFSFLFNQRCLTLAVMSAAFGFSAWLIKKAGQKDTGILYRFQAAWCMILFILCTIEINDFFQQKIAMQSAGQHEYLHFMKLIVIALVWYALSLPLVWMGLRDKTMAVLISGLVILALSTLFIVGRGFEYEPIAEFQLIFNLRTGAILLALGIMLLHKRLISFYYGSIPWLIKITGAVRIGMVLLILTLFTGETIDYFQRQILITFATGDDYQRLNNLRQLSLSGIWLLYSFALMGFGFWRSLRSFRIIAFVLFGFTILKIFIYDLSYLQTLYRIFSFVGLGIILIAVSYVYQKYKDIIFGTIKKETV